MALIQGGHCPWSKIQGGQPTTLTPPCRAPGPTAISVSSERHWQSGVNGIANVPKRLYHYSNQEPLGRQSRARSNHYTLPVFYPDCITPIISMNYLRIQSSYDASSTNIDPKYVSAAYVTLSSSLLILDYRLIYEFSPRNTPCWFVTK